MITIGIDPGQKGALAAIADDAAYQVHDLPYIAEKSLSFVDGQALRSILLDIRRGEQCAVIIERAQAMPKQGSSSGFNYGVGFGSILGVLRALDFPIVFVSPAAWKRGMGLSPDKHASLHRARMLFPDAPLSRMKDEGRAEALLIAYWWRTLPGHGEP